MLRDTAVCFLLQERFYFGDTVLPLFESGIPLVRERLKRLKDADNITIAYPDEGNHGHVGLNQQILGS